MGYDILLKNASYLTPDMELASGDIAMSGGQIAALLPANSGVPSCAASVREMRSANTPPDNISARSATPVRHSVRERRTADARTS